MTIAAWKDSGLSYLDALHGMQSGVAHEMGSGECKDTQPKQLRVGVNSAMVEHSALVLLLIKKGVITEAEYLEELRLAMNNELALYEARHPRVKFR